MRQRQAAQGARRAREFEAFVAGAAGRLLHAATLLTAEDPHDNPRARRLLTLALAHTYASWDRLRGEDPYDRARRHLATRFARAAWHRYGGLGWTWHRYGVPGEARQRYGGLGGTWLRHGVLGEARRRYGGLGRARRRPVGALAVLAPQERLIVVLRLYEGVAEEQAAALLGLPVDRVRALCDRATATLLHPPRGPAPSVAGARVAPS